MAKSWPEPKLIRDIQIFLAFANFYRKFIRNPNRIAMPFIPMLQITNELTSNEIKNTQAKKQEAQGGVSGISDSDSADYTGGAGRNKDNMLNTKKLKNRAKPKKLTLTKVNSFGTDFLTSEVKKTFIYL